MAGFMTGSLLDEFIDELATRDEADRLSAVNEETITENNL
jgi:hypothetical protein